MAQVPKKDEIIKSEYAEFLGKVSDNDLLLLFSRVRMAQRDTLSVAILKIKAAYAEPNYQETVDRSKLHQSEGAYGAIKIIEGLMEDVR